VYENVHLVFYLRAKTLIHKGFQYWHSRWNKLTASRKIFGSIQKPNAYWWEKLRTHKWV